ncbi:unnamed protein product, partial [Sphagnum balticum]
MRLLRMNSDRTFSFIQFPEHDVPSYAVLSHTWRDELEVTFQDVIGSTTTTKTTENGLNLDKLYFCAEQAKKDRLQYFWVDTCCIDKTSSAELSEAINSMFCWYQRSSKCYALLTDVLIHSGNNDLDYIDSQFRRSRWFTRGWTLQELLASASVEFFSREGKPLGSKKLLEKQLSEITGIPIAALRGTPLSFFSTEEKLSWMEKRQTTREEDTVYSLLGIFDLHIPAMYGEGRKHALQRLHSEIEKQLKGPPPWKKSDLQRPINQWIVPFERNAHFTNRESELAELEMKLFANNQFTKVAVYISSAHPDTCNWFFTTAKFQQWRERSNLSSHNGVLWIKGKPGAGKSTLMKHTLGHCRQDFEDHIIAAYFFNARGDKLEKTPLGMLRSLSYQLLKQEPSLYEHFVPIFREKRQKHRTGELEWRESELKEFLLSEIQRCQSKPLLLLIDALDECNQPDVRNVVKFLEELSIKAIDVGASLNICLSSRHYPSIGMKKSLDLVIEEEKKHDDDIAIYVRANLREQDDQIEERILKKASGVFMWVILVVAMLDQAFDEGKVEAMHQKLSELPGDLEQVFETLLSKDNSDKHETIFLLQCVLFARRALTPEELYFAMISGTNPKNVGAWDRSKVTSDVIQKRITHSSKGLIEIRKGGEDRTVQFIHESVNDFLLRNQRLQSLDHALELNAIGTSHDRLRACCMTYLMMSELPLAKEGSQADKLFFDYPFLEYASTYVLDHAEEAQRRGITQQCLVHYLQEGHKHFERFRHFHNIFERIPDLGCDNSVTLLYTLSLHGYCNLVKIVLLEEQVDVNAQGGLYSNALQAASAKGHEEVEVVQLLLEKGADVNAQGGPFGNALQLASAKGNEEVVQLLLEKGADVNAQGGPFGNALQLASAKGHEEVVQLLLEKGADVNAQGGVYRNALQAASAKGREEVVQLLLEKGADVNAQGGVYGNALQAASAKGREEVVQLLLEKGADVNAQGGVYGNALQAALAKGREEVVQLLLEKGADVNAQGGIYGNALQAASAEGDKEVVQLLLEKGADVNAQGGIYGNALQAASAKGDKEVVQLLLEKGADVNAQGGPFGNALQAALAKGHEEVVQLLLEKGADVNAQGEPFGNALQAASAKGDKEVVQLLLEKGADVNAQGGLYSNALQAASAEGYEEVVQLLLEKGAD